MLFSLSYPFSEVRGDLLSAFAAVHDASVARGAKLDLLVIETSGLADPVRGGLQGAAGATR